MAKLVISGAKLECSMGQAPSSLTVLPLGATSADSQPAATIMDMKANVNIAPFGLCRSLANPQVAAATAAALGTLTPMPCLPVTAGPWSPGAQSTSIDGFAALTSSSTCSCAWAGTIKINDSASDIEVD